MSDLKTKYMNKIDEITYKAKSEIEKATEEYYRELKERNTSHWIPVEEERYWWIDTEGYIDWASWYGCTDDEGRLSIGNVFKTEKEAEFEVERLKILAIMKKYSRPFKKEDENWVISFDETENFITYDIWWDINFSVPIFESREMAQKVVEEIGEDRLKKYYFRLE